MDDTLDANDEQLQFADEIGSETGAKLLFIKKGNQWYKQSEWVATFFARTDESPSASYAKLWDERMGKAKTSPAAANKPSKRPADVSGSSSMETTGKKQVKSRALQDKTSSSLGGSISSASRTSASAEVPPRELIVISDQLQDLSKREELSAKHPELYKKLVAGMKGRKEVMQPKNALKFTFVPKSKGGANNVESIITKKQQFAKKRDESRHNRITDILNVTVKSLEIAARREEQAKALKLKKKFPGPLSEPMNLAEHPHPMSSGTSFHHSHPGYFEIDQLIEFAERKKIPVLNIDRFVTATNKRTIHFNEQGHCAYCGVHKKVSVQPHTKCPYIFCACSSCYIIDKLKQKRSD